MDSKIVKMAKKQKRGGTRRRKPAKGIAERDSVDNNNSAIADAALTHPEEVFDSSKYNAMSDMTKVQTWEPEI
jgi:hypothetical protein